MTGKLTIKAVNITIEGDETLFAETKITTDEDLTELWLARVTTMTEEDVSDASREDLENDFLAAIDHIRDLMPRKPSEPTTDRARKMAAIDAREAAATKGPWESTWGEKKPETHPDFGEETVIRAPHLIGTGGIAHVVVGSIWYDGLRTCLRREDAAFIAAAREDVPYLRGEIRDADAALARLGIPDDGRPLAERIEELGARLAGTLEALNEERGSSDTGCECGYGCPPGHGCRGSGVDTEPTSEDLARGGAAIAQMGTKEATIAMLAKKDPGLALDVATANADPLAEMKANMKRTGVADPDATIARMKDPVFRAAFNVDLTALRARREALGDKIDEHDMAEPPTRPPEELVREYHSVGEQIKKAVRAAMGPPRIVVTDVTPLSTSTALCFLDGPGHHGVGEVEGHTYPESPRGAHVREFRQEHGISLGDLARALCVSSADVSNIERGRKTTDDDGWTEIQTALFLLGSGTKPEHVADPASSPSFAKAMARDVKQEGGAS